MGLLATSVLAGTDLTAAAVLQLPVAYPITTGSVSNSTAETVIGTFTVPAGTITAANQGFQFKIFGICGGTGSPTLTPRLRIGGPSGTNIINASGTVTVASAWWALDGWMLFNNIGAGGTVGTLTNISENFSGVITPSGQAFYATSGTAFNTTTAVTIMVTAQFSAANAANTAATNAGNLYQI